MLNRLGRTLRTWRGQVFSARVEESPRLWLIGLAFLWLAAVSLLRAGGTPSAWRALPVTV